MTTITPGSGATITASKLETFLPAVIWKLQELENTPARNPTGINNVTSNIDDDSMTFSANITFQSGVTDGSDGGAYFVPVDYLTTPSGGTAHWVPGTGGTITGSNIQSAIWETVRAIKILENDSTRNPQGLSTVTYSVISNSAGSSTAATVNISISNFPLETTLNVNGQRTIAGKEYLT